VKRFAILTILAFPLPLAAQVGHLPDRSPYRDLEYRQELSFFGGYFDPQVDPAGVAPRPGPQGGVRYEIYLGGPANFYARVAGISSERMHIDPTLTGAAREVGVSSVQLLQADVGITANLTGRKSIFRLVPTISAGLGALSDLGRKADEGSYKFGTPFAISLGAGIRYAPGGRLQLRIDYTDHLYHIRYPDLYFSTATGTATPVLTNTEKRSVWTNNAGITLGASYFFYR
jgi:hypothetical protein